MLPGCALVSWSSCHRDPILITRVTDGGGFLAGALVTAAPAAADYEGTRVYYSPCSSAWTSQGQPGYGRIGMHYKATTSNPSVAILNFARITLDTRYCSPSEPSAPAARLDLSTTITFEGSRLDCSFTVSLPPGVSSTCSASSTSVKITFSTSCRNTSHCEINLNSQYIYADPGQYFRNIAWMQGNAHHVRSDGQYYAWGTPRF